VSELHYRTPRLPHNLHVAARIFSHESITVAAAPTRLSPPAPPAHTRICPPICGGEGLRGEGGGGLLGQLVLQLLQLLQLLLVLVVSLALPGANRF
jgi:hypothetical protein